MFYKIIEFFYPFKEEKEFFVLKNEATWYSQRYRYILYSGNGGKSFRKLLNSERPLFTHGSSVLEYDWSFTYFTFNAEDVSFEYYKKKFTSLNDIYDFQNKEYEIFLKGRQDIKKAREEYCEKLKKNIS